MKLEIKTSVNSGCLAPQKFPEYVLLSTGSKLVSLRLSKPTPNSIWGTEQLPKSPMLDAAAVLVASGAETDTVTASVLVAVGASVASTVIVTSDCQANKHLTR